MAQYRNVGRGEAGRAVAAVNSGHKGQCTALVMQQWNKTGLKINPLMQPSFQMITRSREYYERLMLPLTLIAMKQHNVIMIYFRAE